MIKNDNECLKCEVCKNCCPIENVNYPSFLSVYLGNADNSAVWHCTNCWKCYQICPQKVDLWSIKISFQRKQKGTEGLINGLNNFKQYGYVLPIDKDVNKVRQSMELEPIILPKKEIIEYLFKDD